MENENKNLFKIISITVIFILIIEIIGIGVYTVFVKKDNNQVSDNNQNNSSVDNNKDDENQNSNVEKIYKTKDGKFLLKVIDPNDKNAIETAKKESESFSEGYNIVGYAYLNDELILLLDIKEDESYALYSAMFLGKSGEYNEIFLVDKQKAQVVEQKNISDETWSDLKEEAYYRFNGENNLITFIKTNAGYFFAKVLDDPFTLDIVKVYTTSWQEIGYASLDNIQSDVDGIYVYKKYDSNFNLSGSTTKYDINGNKIN